MANDFAESDNISQLHTIRIKISVSIDGKVPEEHRAKEIVLQWPEAFSYIAGNGETDCGKLAQYKMSRSKVSQIIANYLDKTISMPIEKYYLPESIFWAEDQSKDNSEKLKDAVYNLPPIDQMKILRHLEHMLGKNEFLPPFEC